MVRALSLYNNILNNTVPSGRRTIALPFKTWTRCFASEISGVEASLANSLKETHSIESTLQQHTLTPIARIDDESHRTVDYDSDSVFFKHSVLSHQSLLPSLCVLLPHADTDLQSEQREHSVAT